MPVLKGKKKFIFFLILFFFLTTYELNTDNDFPLFKIKKIEFKYNINLEENIKYKLANYLNNKSLINLDYQKISSFLIESQWVRNFKVNKYYPNKIIIEIYELKPIALFKEKEKFYYINSNFDITNKIVTKNNNSKKILISGIYQKELLKKNFLNIAKFNIAKDIKSIKILKNNCLINSSLCEKYDFDYKLDNFNDHIKSLESDKDIKVINHVEWIQEIDNKYFIKIKGGYDYSDEVLDSSLDIKDVEILSSGKITKYEGHVLVTKNKFFKSFLSYD